MKRAGASKFAALDGWLAENEAQLRAACAGDIAPDRAAAVLSLLTRRAKPDGTCDPTYEQIEKATLLSRDQVRRAVEVLTGLGVLQTVRGGHGPGNNGGKGRAPVRQLSFMVAVETTTDLPADPVDNPNRCAVNGQQVRSQTAIGEQSAAHPYGSLSTETPLRAANAEPSSGHRGGEKDAKTEKRQTASPWQAKLIKRAAERAYAFDESQGLTRQVRDEHAVKATKARTALGHLIELEKEYALEGIEGEAWHQLADILAMAINGKHAHPIALRYLKPYRRQLEPAN